MADGGLVEDIRWKKAALSEGANNCVEIGHTLRVMQDSKNPDGRRLRGDMAVLIAAAKAGKLGR